MIPCDALPRPVDGEDDENANVDEEDGCKMVAGAACPEHEHHLNHSHYGLVLCTIGVGSWCCCSPD
jgi:hypothetical protein